MAEHVKRSNEPAVWFLFGIGGFIAAFLLPVQIFLFGIAFPLGWIPDPGYVAEQALASHVLTRIYLFILVIGCFFHAAHRIRLTMGDLLDLRHLNFAMGATLYGLAAIGVVVTLVMVIIIP
ncbi:MAG: fumarate reductase subunit FrdD [Candidatus Binataceae bacterium]